MVFDFFAFPWNLGKSQCDAHFLSLSEHQLAKVDFALADQVFVIRIVVVPDLEPEVDITDEDEPHAELLQPLRIQVVVDHFCLVIELPCCMFQIRLSGFKRADWV